MFAHYNPSLAVLSQTKNPTSVGIFSVVIMQISLID